MKILIKESSFIQLFEAVDINDIYQKYYSRIPRNEFDKIISSDPTWREDKPNKMGKYGKWLLSLYLSKKLKLEDLYKAKEYLSYFVKYNNVIDNKDINTYKSLNDLYFTIRSYINNPDQPTSKQDAARKIKEGAEKVYEDNEWLIIVPHTKEASCYYGKGTQWCTAADESNNMFDYYNNQGNLYININKNTHEKYQFHFETSSFMDETDSPIEEPICETIGLSESAINWYREHVSEWLKICEESIVIMASDDNNDIVLRKNINSEYWYLTMGDATDVIASDLIIDKNINFDYLEKKLYYDKFITFKNTYGFVTLISYNTDNGHAYLVGHNYKQVSKVSNDYEDVYQLSVVETIDNNDVYELLLVPSIETIYRTSSSKINHANYLNARIIGVYKKNGLIDLINYDGYELNDVKLIDDEIECTDDDCGIVLDSEGNKIKFDLETLDVE